MNETITTNTGMKIVNTIPPIWERAKKAFDIDDSETIYTWGDTIHNPGRIRVNQELIEHETVHMDQQQMTNGGPQAWWDEYIKNSTFRFGQEAAAYGRQHAYFCTENFDRNARARHLHMLATFLSSPLYKCNVPLSEARKAIEKEMKRNLREQSW